MQRRAYSMQRPLSTRGTSQAARLTELFCMLAAIPSPSGSESACGVAVEAELAGLDLAVQRDGSGVSVGGDCDNLYCHIPATRLGGRPLFLCAHLDTVPPTDDLRPVVVDGVIRNATPSIVGADNKASLAVLLDTARTVCAERLPHAGIELLFTVGEEQGLLGSRAFDCSSLRARSGLCSTIRGRSGATWPRRLLGSSCARRCEAAPHIPGSRQSTGSTPSWLSPGQWRHSRKPLRRSA